MDPTGTISTAPRLLPPRSSPISGKVFSRFHFLGKFPIRRENLLVDFEFLRIWSFRFCFGVEIEVVSSESGIILS